MISLTAKALQKILELGGKLYLNLENGGCAEYKYKFSLEPFIGDQLIYNLNGVSIIIPEIEKTRLGEVEIDYESKLIRSGFTIIANPYVAEKCRCGISFK